MQSHSELATLRHLRKLIASDVHDGLGTSLGLVVTLAESLTESFGCVTAEAGGVLLERVAPSAITRSVGVDTKGHAASASITGGRSNCSVAIDSPAGGQNGENECRCSCSHFE